MSTIRTRSMIDKQADQGVVIVRGAGDGFAQEVVAGSHNFPHRRACGGWRNRRGRVRLARRATGSARHAYRPLSPQSPRG